MPTFRKKPIEVEAHLFREISGVDGIIATPSCVVRRPFRRGWWIETLEGWHRVLAGDWVIFGVKDEQYPCKPDIFEATYEPV